MDTATLKGLLGFFIAKHGDVNVLHYAGDGCRPANAEEVRLYEELIASAERVARLEAALKGLLFRLGDVEVLGEWEAMDINFNLRKTVRARVNAAIDVARQALGGGK